MSWKAVHVEEIENSETNPPTAISSYRQAVKKPNIKRSASFIRDSNATKVSGSFIGSKDFCQSERSHYSEANRMTERIAKRNTSQKNLGYELAKKKSILDREMTKLKKDNYFTRSKLNDKSKTERPVSNHRRLLPSAFMKPPIKDTGSILDKVRIQMHP